MCVRVRAINSVGSPFPCESCATIPSTFSPFQHVFFLLGCFCFGEPRPCPSFPRWQHPNYLMWATRSVLTHGYHTPVYISDVYISDVGYAECIDPWLPFPWLPLPFISPLAASKLSDGSTIDPIYARYAALVTLALVTMQHPNYLFGAVSTPSTHGTHILWRTLLYSGFETCFGPSTQGAGPKTQLKSRFCLQVILN